jgi:3-(3-hydroxy-phenyl)propionate hydroxylase
VVYRASPIVEPARGTSVMVARPGAVAPDAPCRRPGSDGVERLRQLLGDGFVALWLPPAGADPAAGAKRALERPPMAPVELLVAAAPGQPPAALPDGAAVVVDTEGALAAAYGPPGTLCLIRPDGHLAARRVGMDLAELGELVDFAAGGRLHTAGRVAARG